VGAPLTGLLRGALMTPAYNVKIRFPSHGGRGIRGKSPARTPNYGSGQDRPGSREQQRSARTGSTTLDDCQLAAAPVRSVRPTTEQATARR